MMLSQEYMVEREAQHTDRNSLDRVSYDTEAMRIEGDPRLLSIMDRLDGVLSDRLGFDYHQAKVVSKLARGEEPIRSHFTNLHVFQFQEEEDGKRHNRVLVVGPTPLGLGISNQSISITKYHASAEKPLETEAIIGQTMFVYTSAELAPVEDLAQLENTSTAVIHFPARTWGDREALVREQPDVYGYTLGAVPAADASMLLQKGVTINGKSGFIYTDNSQENVFVDVLTIAEELVAVLEDKETRRVGSRPMDFDPMRG